MSTGAAGRSVDGAAVVIGGSGLGADVMASLSSCVMADGGVKRGGSELLRGGGTVRGDGAAVGWGAGVGVGVAVARGVGVGVGARGRVRIGASGSTGPWMSVGVGVAVGVGRRNPPGDWVSCASDGTADVPTASANRLAVAKCLMIPGGASEASEGLNRH